MKNKDIGLKSGFCGSDIDISWTTRIKQSAQEKIRLTANCVGTQSSARKERRTHGLLETSTPSNFAFPLGRNKFSSITPNARDSQIQIDPQGNEFVQARKPQRQRNSAGDGQIFIQWRMSRNAPREPLDWPWVHGWERGTVIDISNPKYRSTYLSALEFYEILTFTSLKYPAWFFSWEKIPVWSTKLAKSKIPVKNVIS